ncbi:hypothetical protein J2T57_001571 [Natronocella acetinitrilica]|uniref:Uncharacterized protein n=1 Tax=Natronocella acetinitrilica TaxID=414046 RepID=A0AAE3G2K2_9GAMM|nr:hypothetical protein [Natronocella acetinitrilica]MCP1674469.1 hypothetical protein [Natronocella acetinitrilica]
MDDPAGFGFTVLMLGLGCLSMIAKLLEGPYTFFDSTTKAAFAAVLGNWSYFFYFVSPGEALNPGADGALDWFEAAGITLVAALSGFTLGFAVWLVASVPRWLRGGAQAIAVVADEGERRQHERAVQERDAYARIADEIDSGRLDRGTWVKAFERAKGDRQRAEAEYIRLRKRAMTGR